ncbi:MAG: hypothetical protein GX237_10575 [Clostridiales bacterium]|nr:hypothetical protein [Clostridiales bacterium]
MKAKRLNRLSKILVYLLITSVVINSGTSSIKVAKAQEAYNYAKAFQLSMYFYDANKCGPGVSDGKLSWRGDCHTEDREIPLIPRNDEGYGTNLSAEFISANLQTLDPDGDGCVDLSGGFHDAGDHVNFGLPQSYSGSTLGWGYYEFRDSYISIGEQDHIEEILRWFNDFFIRCTFRDSSGKVVAFAYQVGDGTNDHNYWGPPELQTTPRPAFFASHETPASDQCAGAAASLAINYLNFIDSDPEYAMTCLDTAIALYEFAKENRGLGFSGGFYNSSYDEDEMSWAAVWLNIATGDWTYIDDIISVDSSGTYTGYLSRIISTTASTWQNIWVHSWDTVWGGVFAKLAPITDDPEHWYFFRWNIEYWSGVPHENPNDTTFLAASPEGYRVVNTWGSARYNMTAQLCALVYNKYKPNQDFVNWCKHQTDYLLGDNPMDRCFIVGYAENSAVNPHHRASHGSTTNSMLVPEVQKHVLWGALVGGPDADDYHKDDITDYVYNEVAIDYNAGCVGALAGLYQIYGQGQEPDPTVPEYQIDEKPFYVTSKIEQENSERTQLNIKVFNDTSCPPRLVKGLKTKYFFNITEMLDKGQTIDDFSVQVMYDQALILDGQGVEINGPYAWNTEEGIYYVELDWSNLSFHGNREIQIALVPAQDSSYKVNWDPSNDWSRQGLSKSEEETSYIPVYIGDELVYGIEPGEQGEDVTISIAEPIDGFLADYTEVETPIIFTTLVNNDENVSKVEFYADDIKIGEDETAPYSITFTPENSLDANSKKIKLTAKVITTSGYGVTSKPVNITVKFKEGGTEIPEGNLQLTLTGESTQSSNTISLKFSIKNIGNQDADMSNVKLRYYFTKDSNVGQIFYCDHGGMEFNSSPWYVTISDDVKGDFVDMGSGIEGADTYFELSFQDIAYKLPSGKKLDCQVRIANTDWSNFNQANDYSYQNAEHVVLLIDDVVVSGIEPR